MSDQNMSDQKPENQSEVDELNWLAFRYVTDELNESELLEFEKSA